MELLGILGALLVSYGNVPQILMFFKQGHASGISKSSTWISLIGIILRGGYLAYATNWDPVSVGPYIFYLICLVITFYYLYFGKEIL